MREDTAIRSLAEDDATAFLDRLRAGVGQVARRIGSAWPSGDGLERPCVRFLSHHKESAGQAVDLPPDKGKPGIEELLRILGLLEARPEGLVKNRI